MTTTTKWLGTPFQFFQSGTPLPVPSVTIGAADDMQSRLVSQIPKGWMAIKSANRDIVLGGIADALAWAYSLIQYVKAQTRLLTTTNFMLDLFGYDFLGTRILRRTNQPDASFRTTIQKEIFRERNTRRGIQQAVLDLTGPPVSIFEPKNAQDSGGFGVIFSFNTAGAWGSSTMPDAFLLSCPPPFGIGVPYLSGFNINYGGFNQGALGFADLTKIGGGITEADIFNSIEGTRPAGVTCWVHIGGPAPWAQTEPVVEFVPVTHPVTGTTIYIDELLILGP